MNNGIPRICDKCGKSIAEGNDALDLSLEVSRMQRYGMDYKDADVDAWTATAYLTHPSRHLLPVVEDGRILCQGSPSRAQFLEGQPRDKRGYGYEVKNETLYRAAFRRMRSRISGDQPQES